MPAVEIVAIGNEILLGVTQDTNSSYLCRIVRGRGGSVRRIVVVGDDIEEIAAEITRSIRRKADLVITCGGLGPTDDDLTLRAVARAAGVEVTLDLVAREFVERRYRTLAELGFVSSPEMTETRLKMARLPEGARMIENPVGTAPGTLLKFGNTRIASLPGVPTELRGIVEGPLETFFDEAFGEGCYRERELRVDCGDESVLATELQKVAARHPEVYIKSRASGFGADVGFRVLLSISAKSRHEADKALNAASRDLTRELEAAGIRADDKL